MLVMAASCDQAPPPDDLKEGQLFPSLVLTGFDGETISIDSLRGKVVLLNIWATWCAPCRKELPSLERLENLLDPEKFVIIGLSVDEDVHLAREYLIDRGVTLISYIDQDMQIAEELLGIRIYPDTFIISPNGTLLRRIIGERDWDQPDMLLALEQAHQGEYDLLKNL